MSKKPRKIEESATSYSAKKSAKAERAPEAGPRYADLEKIRVANDKLVQVHRAVLEKLAQ